MIGPSALARLPNRPGFEEVSGDDAIYADD
jgi:hypothetical protein